MSVSVLAPSSGLWYSAHQKLLFGVNQPFYPSGYDTATDDGLGKTVFHISALIIYPFPEFTKKFYVEAGPYAGFHNIISFDSTTQNIYTDTAFVGADPIFPALQRIFYCVIPFGYKILYGYPSQTNSIEIRAFHKYTGTAYVNVSEMIKNIYSIQPPQAGFDENMYTWFRIDIIPLDQTIDFFNTYFLNMQMFTGWNYLISIYYSLNAAIPHSQLQSIVAANKFVCEVDPVFIGDCCNVLTKIILNRAFNLFVCPAGSEFGIGAMIIEENFIIN